jgi:hypothetical protein
LIGFVQLFRHNLIVFSGLDSSSSTYTIRLLHNLAREGRTIVCTIHQPSASIYEVVLKFEVQNVQNSFYNHSSSSITFTFLLKAIAFFKDHIQTRFPTWRLSVSTARSITAPPTICLKSQIVSTETSLISSLKLRSTIIGETQRRPFTSATMTTLQRESTTPFRTELKKNESAFTQKIAKISRES